ncbi:NAD(P)/FAD-dependent oxidoreductase [Amphibacillus jilinensis]|uniref:NAD(P)/FAD-dependent oxidoreductase n=1 Tax=Amphibacillus jilinensis TaxID=1216008 RepID=UPI0002F7C9F9|nr:NAD(P)/FAD-dependent oxidoreductase [Amphibacillus jilinensis]
MNPTKIIIVGAGFAGLTATLYLQKKLTNDNVVITLINKHHYHYQTTWLHRNAVGFYSNERSMFDIESLIHSTSVSIVKETVQDIDVNKQCVRTESNIYDYDYMILALGSEIDTFQIPGLQEHAYSITTLAQSNRLYNRILTVLEDYRKTEMKTPLHFVVGGGGFTGVELLGEWVDQLPKLCLEANVDPNKIKLIAIENQPTVLPEFDLELGEYAMQQLEKKGVEFRLGTKIRSVSRANIKIEQSGLVEDIPASLFVWTAGVKGNQLIEQSALPSNQGRVEVNCDLTAPKYEQVFVIGDVALVRDKSGKPYLPNADLAIQKGKVAAYNVIAKLDGKSQMKPFSFKNRGTIASIGANDAIGLVGEERRIFGKFASVLKKLVDYFFLFQIGGWSLAWRQFRKAK